MRAAWTILGISSAVMCGAAAVSWFRESPVATASASGTTLTVRSNTLSGLPVVVQTWPYLPSTNKAWQVLNSAVDGSLLDAIEAGCHVCEMDQCFGTVGFGGSPDEQGNTTLDAMIMDGNTHSVGAVAQLKRVKSAIGVARAVMEHTEHTLLVGEKATEFAEEMGFATESINTNHSITMWREWMANKCQPNFRKNVVPDARESCGPYKPTPHPTPTRGGRASRANFSQFNHDTIGMVAIDGNGRIAAGTSTNGATNKVPGRVGDSPIPGSGCYVAAGVGGAAATGDGDILMRFLPAYQTVESMRGMSPQEAARHALDRVHHYYPHFSGAIVAVNVTGDHGGACRGFAEFSYTLRSRGMNNATVVPVKCV